MEIRISLICLIAFAKNIRQTSDIRIRFVGADIDAVIGLGVDTCDGCEVSDWFVVDACDGCGGRVIGLIYWRHPQSHSSSIPAATL